MQTNISARSRLNACLVFGEFICTAVQVFSTVNVQDEKLKSDRFLKLFIIGKTCKYASDIEKKHVYFEDALSFSIK